MANEFTATQGMDKILFLRKLADAAVKDAMRLSLQTTHTLTVSSDSDSTATKDGNVNTISPAETELEVENLASADETNELLWDSVENHEKVEAWEVDLSRKNAAGQYYAKYMQGVVNEMESDNDADDNSTGDASFSIDGVPQRGWVTLTEDTKAALAYAFRGLKALTEDDATNGGGISDEEYKKTQVPKP